jgi:predicted Fe-S protein YdhL (DUF1289 family)
MSRTLCALLAGVGMTFLTGSATVRAQQGCSRPLGFPVERWNQMGADAQNAVCRSIGSQAAEQRRQTVVTGGCSRPANVPVSRWNLLGASEQASLCAPKTITQATIGHGNPAATEGCSRPPSVRVEAWNFMGATQQAEICRTAPSSNAIAHSTGTYQPSLGWSTSETVRGCGRACGQPWTADDFAASQL